MPEIWCELDGVQFSRSNCKNLESPNPTKAVGGYFSSTYERVGKRFRRPARRTMEAGKSTYKSDTI
jgi:hypothetical protein